MIDLSEPVVVCALVASVASGGVAAVGGHTFIMISSLVSAVGTAIAEWRIRMLGVAKALMESVDELNEEIDGLKMENDKLADEVKKFENIVGLLDENVGDVEKVKDELFKLWKDYQRENRRAQANNLLSLYSLVDKDRNSVLSKSELDQMSVYIKEVYGETFDFDALDRDDDGGVSIGEFFRRFSDPENHV